uniref:Acetyl-CoA carboxylase n=2 Tax=Panagrellus redivivus TaxID=6233 RepID=A0A7E4WC75_PANRE
MRRQRNRFRTASENFLGTESSSNGIITSSWEVPKTHYGHVRASPSPNRQCAGMPKPEMQTFRVSSLSGNLSNRVDQQNKVFPDVKSFVEHFCEDPSKARCINKVLVATNGIAAVKCILSIRKSLMQLFKDDRIIKFVCLTTEQEIQSKAEYLKMADNIVISPAGANTNNYANVDEIVEHAVRCNADAVWAGWGHASENPRLPEELFRRGIAFIGPPANAMFALGDKIASTIIAQTVDIPTIEWSGSGIKAPEPDASSSTQEMNIPEDIYRQATVSTIDEGLKCLKEKRITYPVMIKASEGGGGKGIRKCTNEQEFVLNFRRVQAEVPGSPIFLMKCMMNARHIEVQLIADQYGNVIPIFTRDCSIQRRCQKIIEEAPAGIAPHEILRRMQQDAVNLAKKVGYVSAGTVEYMYLPTTGKYYFLELNPRLQVEHPCTEMIANVNIPAIQLQIAMGVPLHRIVEIRLFFGMDRYGTSPLPEDQIRTDTNICVIAARITSEDPAEGFRPASGSVEVLNFQSNQNVWGYFSVSSAGKVHEFADSQFGHLFAKGTTRHEAISALMCALKELELRATFQSQINYLVGMLSDPEFENNTFHTGWLDDRIAAKVQSAPEHPIHVTIAVGATVIGHARMSEVFSKFQNAIGRGQILPTSELTETWELELVHNNKKYSVLVNRHGPSDFLVCMNNSIAHTRVHQYDTGGDLLVNFADQSFQCHLDEEMERFKVTIGQTLTIFEKENDPSVLRSRNAGRLLQYLKKDGEHVDVGDIYAEMESMKMVINLDVKKVGGTLVHVARAGQVLFPGTLIARLDEQGDMSASRPDPFEKTFEEWTRAEEIRSQTRLRLNTRFENLVQSCRDILMGYAVPEHMFKDYIIQLVNDLFTILNDRELPFALYKVVLNVVQTRINKIDTYNRIKELLNDDSDFNAAELSETMESYLTSLNPADVGMERSYFESLQTTCDRFSGGLEGHKRIVIRELLEEFLKTEKYFQEVSYDKGVSCISTSISDGQQAVRMVYSHTRIVAKNALLQEMISRLDDPSIDDLQPVLKSIANMFNVENEKLALYVRKVLNRINQSSYGQLCSNLSRKSSRKNLKELVTDCSIIGGDDVFKTLVNSVNGTAEHQALLHEFFFTANTATNTYAVKHFIKLAFHVDESEIDVLPGDHLDATFFKFNIKPTTPFYENNARDNKSIVYFLSVLKKLDLLHQSETVEFLRGHALRDPLAYNVFLFVAFPTGDNGFSTAINWSENKLRSLGVQLRTEVETKLSKKGIPVGSVDLMISRPSNPPIYAEHDFSAKMKLELRRLPPNTVDISTQHSPYLLFRNTDSDIQRLFVRYLLRDVASVVRVEKYTKTSPLEKFLAKLIDVIDGACGEIRVCTHADKASTYDCNHIFICVDYDPVVSTVGWATTIKEALVYYEKCLIKLRVTEVEILFKSNTGSHVESYRAVYSNETGAIPEFSLYRISNGRLQVVGDGPAKLDGTESFEIHRPIAHVSVQRRRMMAQKISTTYCYDLPTVFGRAVLDLWKEFKVRNPQAFQQLYDRKLTKERQSAIVRQDSSAFCSAYEMILESEDGPINVIRDPEELQRRKNHPQHDRAMVAWEMHISTPDCPQGRKVVVIANDITFKMGSFSMREHKLYYYASEYSRRHKMPRVYIAANSGARIGFAADIKENLDVIWTDAAKPEEGFESLCLQTSASETKSVLAQIEYTKRDDGKVIIDAVIGKEDDIGVENLVGSGLIAGETSAAYKEVPTYCLVTGRAVGIGAYAARLSHRVVQVEPSHLILTGAPALNSLLGREIYTSNGQLGGSQIMHRNGVSHSVAQSDLEGVTKVVRWISYLPVNETLPAQIRCDDGERRVLTQVPKGQYDPRLVLDPPEGGGLFDANSLDEIMDAWAKTIITGRARLCGEPVGVIAVETRTISFEIPADPAAQDSQSRTVTQAGQVWYPDSAYKTAEAINDFNREGLPLIMLANMRGFSGGQKDMFEMVLKFGACIVDALHAYTQPVIVYIPPYSELRGGAWAVLDTKINPTCITMLADSESRGGVLEPDGMVEIKFRKPDLMKLMSKCDKQIKTLEGQRDTATTETDLADFKKQIQKRQDFLMPMYRTVAVKFADLHDTTARLLAKDAIHDKLSWTDARIYLHKLLQVQLARMAMARRYLTATGLEAPFDVKQLEVGCKWVDSHLAEVNIVYRHENKGNQNSRYSHDAAQLIRYAQSNEFSRVLQEIDIQNTSSKILSKLNGLQSDSQSALIQNILLSADADVRSGILRQMLSLVSSDERKKLLSGLP